MTQLALWPSGQDPFPADGLPRPKADVGLVEMSPEPVPCPVPCLGTTGCLCGQGELSDDPLWIEND